MQQHLLRKKVVAFPRVYPPRKSCRWEGGDSELLTFSLRFLPVEAQTHNSDSKLPSLSFFFSFHSRGVVQSGGLVFAGVFFLFLTRKPVSI